MSSRTPFRLRSGLLTLCLLLGGAGAERTVAPTPLYASPDLGGTPVQTLPSGTPLAPIERREGRPGEKPVLAVLAGDRVLYARAGTVAYTDTGVNLIGRESYFGYISPQPSGQAASLILTRNLERAEGRVTAWQVRVLPLDAARLDGAGLNPTPPPRVTGSAVRTLTVKASGERTEVDLGRLVPGLYLVATARADAPSKPLATAVLQVTDLALTTLTTPTGVEVWATRLDTGAPLSGVRLDAVALRPPNEEEQRREGAWRYRPARVLAPVTTDARGFARLGLRDGERLWLRGRVTLGGATHRAVLGVDDYGLGAGTPERARAYLQTDKPVYRPGETLQGLAVTRSLGAGTRTPWRGALTVRLVSGPGDVLAQARVTANASGLARFSFPLPEGVRTGEYRLEAELPAAPSPANPKPLPDVSSVPVRVQAFVKPQFTLDMTAPREVVTGASVPVTARAERYEGGGANVPVEFTLLGGSDQSELWPGAVPGISGRPDFEWISPDTWRSSAFLTVPQDRAPAARLQTRQGTGTVNLPLTAPNGRPRDHVVIVRARDEYGRDVLASVPVTVHPAGLRLELLRWPRLTGGRASATLRVRAVGPGTPLPGRAVTATVVRVWQERVAQGGRIEYRERQATVQTQTLRSGAGGTLTVTAPATGSGSYTLRLEARDAAGRVTRSNVSLGYVPEPSTQAPGVRFTLALDPDRDTYGVGDTARLTLRTTLPVGTPVRLTAAAEGRLTTRTVRVTGRTQTLTWKVTPDLSPGFTVQATAVAGAESVRAGTPLLYVPRSDRQLAVTVKPSVPQARPGEEVTLSVDTRAGGKGASALVTLAVVNEAVYAVAPDPSPDPWRFLWGATYPRVEVRSSAGAPADGGGGGGADQNGAPLRQDLREVAYFGAVQTGADGRAQVKVKLPEALGRYRITARAFTGSGGAGDTRAGITAALPFAVRLTGPRVLTQGDVGSAYLGVQDRTGAKAAQVALTVGTDVLTRALTLNGGDAVARFPLQAPASGQKLPLEARATSSSGKADALRLTLPLRPAGPRTRLTREGTLTTASTRTVDFGVPSGEQAEALTLTLAATPLQAALADLDAYLADPTQRWITTDAVAARLRANLDLVGLAGPLGWPDVRERALSQARRDLATLLALRQFGGENGAGWSWTAQGPVTGEQTAHALTALVGAKGAGLTDAATLRGAVDAARGLLGKASAGDRAHLASALALAGDMAPALSLARSGGVREAGVQAQLAAALAPSPAAGARAAALSLYRAARAQAERTPDGGLLLADDVTATAHLLDAAQALGQTADAPLLLRTLLDRRTGGAWEGPLATAAALGALREAVAGETRRPTTRVTVTQANFTRDLTLGPPVRLSLPSSGAASPLGLTANGPLAYRAELDARTAGSKPAALSPIVVERRYDRSRVERDGLVTVTLTLRTPVALRHLRLTDPLPGGLEAVDDRPFAFPGAVASAGQTAAAWADRSLYDDRAVFYLERLPAGVTTVRYRLRALAPGTYTAPAPRVESASGLPPAQGQAQRVEVVEKE
ncbi:MG2 domain-containing protein [Deinococcus sp. NW-56]|uniref:alpha-2-macroglobulin family protein n=1 Tax=Deinococcus sp. NW-56 TaxID=2080419 RepID=UPI000CF46101|nr:MG2 domain-containing protein [Deinococcus sp. NW-56]